MKLQTFSKHYNSLSKALSEHPHKTELLNILSQQLTDDTPVIAKQVIVKV